MVTFVTYSDSDLSNYFHISPQSVSKLNMLLIKKHANKKRFQIYAYATVETSFHGTDVGIQAEQQWYWG